MICDRHDSHCTADFLAHCIEYKILLFLLVPHSSHIVQPLDAGLFRVVKLKLSEYIAPILELRAAKIQKSEWLEAYHPACTDAFTVNNIKSTFSSIGIHPFDPSKAINHLPLARQNLPSTPLTSVVLPCTSTTPIMTTTTPFPAQVLTSSLFNFTISQAVNSTLNHMIESAEPLLIPVRKFIRSLTSTVEKLFTYTSILQERTEAQEALLAARQY